MKFEVKYAISLDLGCDIDDVERPSTEMETRARSIINSMNNSCIVGGYVLIEDVKRGAIIWYDIVDSQIRQKVVAETLDSFADKMKSLIGDAQHRADRRQREVRREKKARRANYDAVEEIQAQHRATQWGYKNNLDHINGTLFRH